MFMDLCNEEEITHGIKGGSLNVKFQKVVGSKIKDIKEVCFPQRQSKNQRDYQSKHIIYHTNIVGKFGHGYDQLTNTVNWSSR